MDLTRTIAASYLRLHTFGCRECAAIHNHACWKASDLTNTDRDQATLIETAKLNSIEPHAWLADILTRLANLWPNNRLDELLNWAWIAARRQQQRAA